MSMRQFFSERRATVLLSLAALSLVASLMLARVPLTRASYDYLIVFDISQSMNVSDGPAQAQRLKGATHALTRALEALPCGARLGLGLFSGHRVFLLFTPIEVCEHFDPIAEMIDAIDWRMAWEARSEIAKGLEQARELAAELGESVRVVFVTDGHEAPPVNPRFAPRFSDDIAPTGVIVGIGGLEPRPIPKYDYDNEPQGDWQADEVMQVDVYSLGRAGNRGESMVGVDAGDIEARIARGTEHLSSLKAAYLQGLADRTGLDYTHLTTPDGFAKILLQRDLATDKRQATDIRWLFALGAMGLLIWVHRHDRQ